MNPDRSLDLNASRLLTALSGEPLSLGDVDAVRLLLKGNSVIDWNRAHFGTRDDVDRFLRLHLLDPDDPEAVLAAVEAFLDARQRSAGG